MREENFRVRAATISDNLGLIFFQSLFPQIVLFSQFFFGFVISRSFKRLQYDVLSLFSPEAGLITMKKHGKKLSSQYEINLRLTLYFQSRNWQ